MTTTNNQQLAQHFGAWSMYEPIFNAALSRFRSIDLAAHIANREIDPLWESGADGKSAKRIGVGADGVAPIMAITDGVAVVDVVGIMTKFGSSFSQMAGGTIAIRRAIRSAAANDAVDGIVLRIDSPGGTVSGTPDLAADVAAANSKKPVVAFIEDMGASAAFWVAAAAGTIIANANALVGSIGVVGAVVDSSESEKTNGRRVIVVRSGPNKGIGIPGDAITDEQVATLQNEVNAQFALFVAAVSRGRKMTTAAVAALADGRVFVGADAVGVGLVDRISMFDSVIDEMVNGRAGGVTATQRVSTMSNKNDTEPVATATATEPAPPQPATLAQLKAAIPDSDAAFRESCMESNCSLEQANAKYADVLRAKVEAAEKRAADAEARAKAADAVSENTLVGVEPAGNGGSPGSDAEGSERETWLSEIRKEVERNGGDRMAAVRAANKNNPGLRERMLAETNAAV